MHGPKHYESFFKLAHPFWFITIVPSLYCLGLSLYAPQFVTWHFGPLGQVAKYLVETYPEVMTWIFLFGVFLHSGEPVIALYYCRKHNLDWASTAKWMVQTFLLGVFSLYILVLYDRENTKKRVKRSE